MSALGRNAMSEIAKSGHQVHDSVRSRRQQNMHGPRQVSAEVAGA